jgi:hypothetical protein
VPESQAPVAGSARNRTRAVRAAKPCSLPAAAAARHIAPATVRRPGSLPLARPSRTRPRREAAPRPSAAWAARVRF